MCERVTIVPELEVAGTMDRIVKHKGEAKIGDVKTGSTVEYSGMEIAMQLAIYAHGQGLWNEDTGEWEQIPKVSQTEGLVFHIPVGEGRATLYSVDLEFGWQVAKTAYLVRRWRKDKDILVPYPERG
jgi:RecB family exonuclease